MMTFQVRYKMCCVAEHALKIAMVLSSSATEKTSRIWFIYRSNKNDVILTHIVR